jgi:hypothetical protein
LRPVWWYRTSDDLAGFLPAAFDELAVVLVPGVGWKRHAIGAARTKLALTVLPWCVVTALGY